MSPVHSCSPHILWGNATNRAAAPWSLVRHRAAVLPLCSCSEDPGDIFPEPGGIAPDSVARASAAPHSSPDPPQSTDPDNSSTTPDRPTTGAPSRAPGPACRPREYADQDPDPSPPPHSQPR